MNQTYSVLDVVKQDLCTGCGVCVSESKSTLKMGWDESGFLVPQSIGNSISKDAIKVCPFNPSPDEVVQDEDKLGLIYFENSTNYDPKIGRFENTYVGYSNHYRDTSSSGGLATYIFKQLLEDKVVENLFIVKEVNDSYEYQMFNNINDILKISKTRYIPVTLEELFLQIDKVEGKIAVSGVACFIKAIRLKQHYNPNLKEKIPFLVGIICGGLKSKFYSDYLAQKSGIFSSYSNQEYRIKDSKNSATDYSFGANDNLGQFHQIKMQKVGDMWGTGLFKSNACDFCTDVLTELADISLGDAWLDEYREDGLGNSVIVTRSMVADKLIRNGIQQGVLSVELIDKNKIISSQSPSFSHRQEGIKLRLLFRKIKGQQVPFVRKRVLKFSNITYSLVQIQRQRTRSKSLKIWKRFSNCKSFDLKIKSDLRLLALLTKIYHKLR